MTTEMVASVLQAQKVAAGGEERKGDSDGGMPTGTSGMFMQLVPPPLAQHGEAQQPDPKRPRLTPNGSDSSALHAQYAHKGAQSTGNVPVGAWVMGPNGAMLIPPNAPMSMWMPAAAQDISHDHLLRPPVA